MPAKNTKSIIRNAARIGYRTLRRASFALSSSRGAVIFAGDSLIARWTTLPNDFPKLKIVNRGISGDLSSELLARLSKDVLSLRPSAVVILIGTNDLAAGIPPKDVAANIRRILDKIGDKIPVVLCRVLPRTAVPGLFPDQIHELNRLIDGLAFGINVADTFAPLANDDGSCQEDLFTDGLHLNAAGYKTLAEALNPALSRLI